MIRVIRIQELAVSLLTFFLSLSLKTRWWDAFNAGIYDKFIIDYFSGTLVITLLAGDVEMGTVTYEATDAGYELIELITLEGIDIEFLPEQLIYLFEGFSKFEEPAVSVKLIVARATRRSGSCEVVVDRIGSVVADYNISRRDRKVDLRIDRIAASINPSITSRPVVT